MIPLQSQPWYNSEETIERNWGNSFIKMQDIKSSITEAEEIFKAEFRTT